MKAKKYWIIPLVAGLVFLATGASFHGYRMNPQDRSAYELGVTMGITMLSLALASFVIMIVLIIIKRKHKKP